MEQTTPFEMQIPAEMSNQITGSEPIVSTADIIFVLVIISISVAFDVFRWRKSKKKDSILCTRHHKDHTVPQRAKTGDAGFDLFCDEDITVGVNEEASISLGIAIKIPDDAVGLILPRSSANKLGLHVKIGVIDSGYVGPLFALVHNISKKPVEIKRGMRICQVLPMALHQTMRVMTEVIELPKTERGTSGFGSTGDAAQHVDNRLPV